MGWLDKYSDKAQKGKDVPKKKPIVVSDKNDPRYKAYQDSLDIYNNFINVNKQLSEKYKTNEFYTKKTEYRKNPDGSICYECIKQEALKKNIKGKFYDKNNQLVSPNINPKGRINYLKDNLLFDDSQIVLQDYSNVKPKQQVILQEKKPTKTDSLNLYNKGEKNKLKLKNVKEYPFDITDDLKTTSKNSEAHKDFLRTGIKPTKEYVGKNEKGEVEYSYGYKKPTQPVILEEQKREKQTPVSTIPIDIKPVNSSLQIQTSELSPMARVPKKFKVETSGGGKFGGWTRTEEVTDFDNISADKGNKRTITPIYQKGGNIPMTSWELQQAKVKHEKDAKLQELLKDKSYVKNLEKESASRRSQVPTEQYTTIKDVATAPLQNRPERTSNTARNKTNKEIAQERQLARQAADVNPLNTGLGILNPDNNTRENWAITAKGLESQYRLSDEPNFVDDYLNPFNMVGGMASNLGQAPLQAQQSDSYLPYATAIGMPLTIGAVSGVGANSTGQFVNNLTNPLAGTEDIVTQLRKELYEKGILQSQKTLNLPWKEPIRKGVEPWGYDMKEKIKDLKSLFKDSTNPSYINPDKIDKSYTTYLKTVKSQDQALTKEEYIKSLNQDQLFSSNRAKVNNRFDNRFDDEYNDILRKNRYATWDMYLGKPQTQNPMYDISEFTKSKNNPVYTIKEEFMNKPSLEVRLGDHIDDILQADRQGRTRMPQILDRSDMIKKENKWIVPDRDNNLFGTMGGFHWEIEKMADGNFKAIANDVWDIQPLKNAVIGDSDKLSGRLLNKAIKPIKNIEAGKALGIGKPLNVKVGFTIDGKTKKIINTFGLAGAVSTAAVSSQGEIETPSIKKNGGTIKDDRGQWAHPGEITEIGSPNITMQGVNYPVLGVSKQTGEQKMMFPEKNYSFSKTKQVIEYPLINWLDKY
jgi:hypothetical protein